MVEEYVLCDTLHCRSVIMQRYMLNYLYQLVKGLSLFENYPFFVAMTILSLFSSFFGNDCKFAMISTEI
jgi:hypothetical protein